MKSKCVVLFPGVNYGTDCPLLYYTGFQYNLAGYEVIPITSYKVKRSSAAAGKRPADMADYAGQAFKNTKKALADIPFREYREIIFASKSIGTVIALMLEDELALKNVTHILFTPIERTLPLMEKRRNYRYIVSGTADKTVNLENLKTLCRKKQLPLEIFENAGHRLELPKNDSCRISPSAPAPNSGPHTPQTSLMPALKQNLEILAAVLEHSAPTDIE